ncbi:ATP-binding protein [Frigoribacterium salinisoli]
MESNELQDVIESMRRIGGEFDDVELKSAAGGYPKSVVETIVAFANTRGGTLVLGVDEDAGFDVVGLSNAAATRTTLVGQAADAVVPAIPVETDFVEIEGKVCLVATVSELPAHLKPAYVKTKGPWAGAYVRSGDGDRKMTTAEVELLHASRSQPLDDREPVLDASMDDLHRTALLRSLERLRRDVPSFAEASDEDVLRRIGVLVFTPDREALVPSLAGLLAFGSFPQEFFPQLFVSFTARGADMADGERFVDNVTVRGSIPEMVAQTIAAARRNMSARSLVSAEGRQERFEYSLEAVREAVVNALLHRDYSSLTRGTQVQIEITPDSIVVRNPGGLYGPVSEDDLGEEGISSSRNATLAQILSDTYMPASDRLVAENRASGIPRIISEARAYGQGRPQFANSITQFRVTMNGSELLSADTLRWLAAVGAADLGPNHRLALAMMRQGHVTNEALREWGADRIEAGAVLRELVEAGLAVKEGGRRYARYVLPADVRATVEAARSKAQVQVQVHEGTPGEVLLATLQGGQPLTARGLSTRTQLAPSTVRWWLRKLIDEGKIEGLGALTSPLRAYRTISSDIGE